MNNQVIILIHNQINNQVFNQKIIVLMYAMEARHVGTSPRPRASSKYECPLATNLHRHHPFFCDSLAILARVHAINPLPFQQCPGILEFLWFSARV